MFHELRSSSSFGVSGSGTWKHQFRDSLEGVHASTPRWSTQPSAVGGDVHRVFLQPINTQEEEEASCATCFCPLQIRASVHRRKAHSCTLESCRSARCVKLWRRQQLQLQHSSCTAMFWFKNGARLNTTAVHFLVVLHWSHGPCVPDSCLSTSFSARL